jgi:glycosyltransferase involved in cell wall biosynthesis
VDAFDEGYLREAVGSLLAQTSPRWKLVIVTERRRLAALEELLERELGDSRITLRLNEGRKLAGALNTGMRHAESDFVAILLGDDLWAPDAVEVLGRRIAASPEADFFHSSRRYVDDEGRAISGIYTSRASIALEDFATGTPVKHLLCWRRTLALSFGGMEESLDAGADDYDFPWSMAEHGAVFRAIPECLYVYRDHRRSYRLTTHLPVSRHVRDLAAIMARHGVAAETVSRRVAEARSSYLRQCLYATPADRWVKRLTGAGARDEWREAYSEP